MKIAIMQPTFVPWAGYFGLISYVDKFIFLDDVQFDRRSWQQRNKIFENNKAVFLSTPVINKNLRNQKINEAKIDTKSKLKKKFIKRLLQNYSKAKYYDQYNHFFEKILNKEFQYLSDMNIFLIKELCKIVKIHTQFYKSSEIYSKGNKSEKLINICENFRANEYVAVEGSKSYIDDDKILLKKKKIQIIYFDYKETEYHTFYNKFIPKLSIIDLIFNCGLNSKKIILSGIKN